MTMRWLAVFLFFLSASVLLNAGTVDPSAYYFVTTGHTTANTQIDVSHSSQWTFTVGSTILFGGGLFVMKDGPQTTDPTTLRVTDNTVPASSSINEPNSSFSQSYSPVYHLFTPFTLTAGHEYTVTLTSLAPSNGSHQYFIKGIDAAGMYKGGIVTPENGTPITPQGFTTDIIELPVGDVPEPGSWLLIAGGVLMVASRAVRQHRPAARR